ncbi:MAG TPA: iron chelate uptake ABC transporter family permease subunit [Thermodesulfobacteriota bacterium]|nr:iron chelate uptake ABC transporter family permease subunit [Thermodesulfobacteriota bacterium]
MDTSSFGEFIKSYFLWRDPMIVGAVSGAICGFLGVYVVLRRIVFVGAMLSQVSSFGVVLAFYIGGFSAFSSLGSMIDPFALSLIMTALAALFFALKKDFLRISQEGAIGFGYLLTSGAVVIIGNLITHEAHDIADILFGSAVVVDPKEVYIVPGVALFCILIHLLFFKDFIFVSFDPETAQLFKYPVRVLNTVLLLTVGIVIAITTRALGALPVFGLTVLPSLTALFLTERLKLVFIFSALIGVVSAVLGYYFSFVISIPTGASITTCASLFFILGIGWREVRHLI